jgi:RNA polymerase sigma-70 factor, ECF subfamily
LPDNIHKSETELIAALKNRGNEAFRYLYQNYRTSLYSVISQIITNEETAADVLQESFITIWKNIDKYDPAKGRLFTWLLNVTRNTAINKLRSKEYKNSLKNETLENFVYTIDEKESLRTNINEIGLRKLTGELKKELRDVLELAYFTGFTQEEISKTLNIPLGTVKTRLRSGIIELRKKFS